LQFQSDVLSDFQLTDEEAIIIKKGRNAVSSRKTTIPKRFSASTEAPGNTYGDASGFEALVGWLWLGGGGGKERLDEVFTEVDKRLE